jgi:hypothetical protein
MIAAGIDIMICDVGQSVAFGDKTIEVVKEFVYLDSLVTSNNDINLEIQRRIQVVRPSVKSNKIHNFKDLDPPGPTIWQ